MIHDLQASLNRSLDISQGFTVADTDEFTKIQTSFKGVMKISDTVIRVPVYMKRTEDAIPALVMEFDCSKPYPAKPPLMRVVTAEQYIRKELWSDLLDWLAVQTENKTGQPMLSGIVSLCSMWVEVQKDMEDERRRREAEEERKAALKAKVEEEARVAEEKRKEEEEQKRLDQEERRRMIEAGEIEEDEEEEEEDSGEGRHKTALKFKIAPGAIPTLGDLCIKVFGDCLLMFEGFDVVPIQIRAKVFNYLVDSNSLSHRKLALLVGEDAKKLNLSKCAAYLKDHYLEVLKGTPQLAKLYVPGAHKLSDKGFVHIANCGKLTDLNVSGTNITSSAFDSIIMGCPNLVKVNIANCTSMTYGLAALAKRCDKLSYLNCSGCNKISHTDLLKVLHLAGPCFTVFQAAGCGEMKEVKSDSRPVYSHYWGARQYTAQVLTVEYDKLTRPLLGLVSLDFSDCAFLNDHFATLYFGCTMPKLQKFEHRNTELSSAGLMHILSKCPGMVRFSTAGWSRDSEQIKKQSQYFKVFMDSAVMSNTLREVEIKSNEHITLDMLTSLTKLKSLQKLHLIRLTNPSFRFIELMLLISKMKGLKILRLHGLDTNVSDDDLKNKVVGVSGVEALQLWDLANLTDKVMSSVVLRCFGGLKTLSLRGVCSVSGDGLEEIVNTCMSMHTLTLDADTGISNPLSRLLDTTHKAPIHTLNLMFYALDKLFTNRSLDTILDENKVTNDKIKSISLEREIKTCTDANFPLIFQANFPLIFQALFFLCPFLENLDLCHQFYNLFPGGRLINLPNNTLKTLKYCIRHDSAKIVNPNAGTAMNSYDCSPTSDHEGDRRWKTWGDRDYESSDEEFDMNLADLFD